MHLLNTSTREIKEFPPGITPPYIILSHRWEDEEVSYKDLTEPKKDPSTLKGWTKLDSFCSLAKLDGWEWVWMDTCCIDKSSSAELSEAINSMYQWYRKAEFCIAYLADISVFKDETEMKRRQFDQSEWFKRGWTLQELLAPREVVFYDKSWESIGTRTTLKAYVSDATRISRDHLSEPLKASVAAKMSWASKRQTSRPEDIAYSLLGLFQVNMPLLYGEGDLKAFQRLQYEVVRSRRDESIFAWSHSLISLYSPASGLLAPSPNNFSDSGNIVPMDSIDFGHAKLHAPQILFDGLVWTLERSFVNDDHPKKKETLREDETLYVAPLACSTASDRSAPVKLQIVMSQNGPLRRWPSLSLEVFSESEMQRLRNAQAKSIHIFQEQTQAVSYYPVVPKEFACGFTLRLSTSAQHQFSTPSLYGPFIELPRNGESGKYFVKPSGGQHPVGIVMQHRKGAVVKVACDSFSRCPPLGSWRLVMEINRKKYSIRFNSMTPSEGFNLGDRVIVSLEQGQDISVSPKHGQSWHQHVVVVYIDCNAETSMDLEGIFKGIELEE